MNRQHKGQQAISYSKSLEPRVKLSKQPDSIMLLGKFYEKLSNKPKITQLNFISKNHGSTPKKDPQQQDSPSPDNTGKEGIPAQKSDFHTKSVFLPALKHKAKGSQFKEKLIINDTIFIHERIPIDNNSKTINTDENIGKKNGVKAFLDPNLSPLSKRGGEIGRGKVESVSKSLRGLGDIQVIEISSTTIIKLDQIESPVRSRLSRHKSIDKLIKIQNSPICEDPAPVKSHKPKPQTVTLDPNDPELYKKKSKIQKMIQYYKLRKIKAEEKVFSQKNIVSQAFQEMEKISIRGQHPTAYYSKKESPNKRKKGELILKERSFTELVKINYNTWKTREFPISDLLKAEASKLFAYYLGLREVTPISSGNYKVYVGEGNNSQLVARILRNRGWWVPTDDISQAHLIWTQHPQVQLMAKVQPCEALKLQKQSAVNFLIPSNQSYELQSTILDKFKKHKQSNFFQACSRLLHPILSHKIQLQICEKFKQSKHIKNYMYLKDIVSKNLAASPSICIESKNQVVFNHCEHADEIGDKKNLMSHVEQYCAINQIDKNRLIPRTVHLNQGDIENFKGAARREEAIGHQLGEFEQEDALYILKPGESSNRGNGITIHPSKSALVQHISKSLTNFPESKTYIVQEYIDPLLYEGRKFDIRMWALYSNNKLWFYREGYVRTSSKEYTTKNMSKYVHLTNDAVQKYSDDYGKYEPANKVSFADLDKYLKKTHNYDQFYSEIYLRIKHLTKVLFQTGMLMLGKVSGQFQLFGLDFLIDRNFGVWLIECNTNPSIEICSSLLTRLVPNMLDNLITIAVDPFFPPSQKKVVREEAEWQVEKFNFELLSDASIEVQFLGKVMEDQQYFQYLRNVNPHRVGQLKKKSQKQQSEQQQ